jgi:hypothetical protein
MEVVTNGDTESGVANVPISVASENGRSQPTLTMSETATTRIPKLLVVQTRETM